MADMGCQYFGNGKSLFYNGRDLGFKAFARVALSVADTCSTGLAFNGSFPSNDLRRQMSICTDPSDTPVITIPITENNKYNNLFKGSGAASGNAYGYLGALIPSAFQLVNLILIPGFVPTLPTMTLGIYECDVQKFANSVGTYILMLFLVFLRFYVFCKSVYALKQIGTSKPLASTGILFGGILAGIANILELIGSPNDLGSVNYTMMYGQKDQALMLYLPQCLGICSNLAMAWLWMRIGLNLRRLMKSRLYDAVGVLIALVPLPILIPMMSSGSFDLYDGDGLVRQGVDAILALEDPFAAGVEKRAERKDLYDKLNIIIFAFSIAVAAFFVVVQIASLARVMQASKVAQSKKAKKTMRKISLLVLVQSVCLISTAMIIFYLQDFGWEIVQWDGLGQLIAHTYIRVFIFTVMAWAQVNAIVSSAVAQDKAGKSVTTNVGELVRDSSYVDSLHTGRKSVLGIAADLRNSVFGGAETRKSVARKKSVEEAPAGKVVADSGTACTISTNSGSKLEDKHDRVPENIAPGVEA